MAFGSSSEQRGTATGPAGIRLASVSKTYGSVQALREVTLDFPVGQVCGLLGPNGAGKTTLLRIVLGLVRSDAGSVSVLGRPPGAPTRRCGASAR